MDRPKSWLLWLAVIAGLVLLSVFASDEIGNKVQRSLPDGPIIRFDFPQF